MTRYRNRFAGSLTIKALQVSTSAEARNEKTGFTYQSLPQIAKRSASFSFSVDLSLPLSLEQSLLPWPISSISPNLLSLSLWRTSIVVIVPFSDLFHHLIWYVVCLSIPMTLIQLGATETKNCKFSSNRKHPDTDTAYILHVLDFQESRSSQSWYKAWAEIGGLGLAAHHGVWYTEPLYVQNSYWSLE